MVFGCFGYIETPKQAVLILKQNNRNKRLVSDSAETSFSYIETKQVSYDILCLLKWFLVVANQYCEESRKSKQNHHVNALYRVDTKWRFNFFASIASC
jgi:hypothetical protein